MGDYILFMHGDVNDRPMAGDGERWNTYLSMLRQSEHFTGGSSIKVGWSANRSGTAKPPSGITGFIQVRAANIEEAKLFLKGNPVYDAGGTVEICELVRS